MRFTVRWGCKHTIAGAAGKIPAGLGLWCLKMSMSLWSALASGTQVCLMAKTIARSPNSVIVSPMSLSSVVLVGVELAEAMLIKVVPIHVLRRLKPLGLALSGRPL